MSEEFKHISVLMAETLDALAINPEGIYIDGTFGRGGHSGEILKRLTSGRLQAIDQDPQAIKLLRSLLMIRVLQSRAVVSQK